MYIQITTRCNMLCKHCCYSCTSEGHDMDRDVFLAACQLAMSLGDFPDIDIGGGEPTLHSLFWDFIGIALRYMNSVQLCMATNGKLKDDAIALSRLAKDRVLRVDLSQDRFHEPIHPDVVQAFMKSSGKACTPTDYRGIRDITYNGTKAPAPFGRAKGWADLKDIRCPANDLFVSPDGTLYACGCRSVMYGNVFNPQLPDPIPDECRKIEWCPDKLG